MRCGNFRRFYPAITFLFRFVWSYTAYLVSTQIDNQQFLVCNPMLPTCDLQLLRPVITLVSFYIAWVSYYMAYVKLHTELRPLHYSILRFRGDHCVWYRVSMLYLLTISKCFSSDKHFLSYTNTSCIPYSSSVLELFITLVLCATCSRNSVCKVLPLNYSYLYICIIILIDIIIMINNSLVIIITCSILFHRFIFIFFYFFLICIFF